MALDADLVTFKELVIDPEEAVARRIVWDMVEGDTNPMIVRFLGLDLSRYDSVKFYIRREDGTKVSRTMVLSGTDPEVATVPWTAADLTVGRHNAEIELAIGTVSTTLPRRFPIQLVVRQQIY
jgi:hypothetical protein